jgi:hypothetical protein
VTSTKTVKESVVRRARHHRAARVSAAVAGLAVGLGWAAAAPALAEPSESRTVHVEGHSLPVAESPGVYLVHRCVGTYTLRSERIIHAWTYFGTQIREIEGTGLINGCVDQNQNLSCDAGEPSGELGLTFNRVASFNTRTDRLIQGRSIHQASRSGPSSGGVLTMRDVPVGNSDEILRTYEGDLQVQDAAEMNRAN